MLLVGAAWPVTWHLSQSATCAPPPLPICKEKSKCVSYRLKLFFIRPLLLPQVQLLSALGAWQVLLVHNCAQPCPTAPVLPLSTAIGLGCGGSCLARLHIQVTQSMAYLMVQPLHRHTAALVTNHYHTSGTSSSMSKCQLLLTG